MFFRKKKKPRKHHNVYVVELSPEVLKERKFLEANPDRDASKPCVYVGMTGLAPEERFANHKKGHKSNRYVQRYGVRLRPRLYAKYNPMAFAAAARMEKKLAQKLRKRGYAVWQH